MTRALTTTDSAAALSSALGLVRFLEIDWPWGADYLTDADRAYTWGGNTYSPSAKFGNIANLVESTDNSPRPVQITLSGLDATTVQNAISENICWLDIVYSIGFIDSGNDLLDDPTLSFPLNLGDCSISLDRNSGTLTITAECLLADLQNRTSGCLATQADQQARFSGDTYFSLLSALQDQQVYWGQTGPATVGHPGDNYQYVKPPIGGPKMEGP